MKKIIMLLLIISSLAFGKSVESINKDIDKLFTIVNQYQDIKLKGEYLRVDLKELLKLTAQVESRYGRDNYKNRVAKGVFQYEMATAIYYVKQVGILKSYIEEQLGRKIDVNNEDDCVYITYLIYMSKFRFHFDWLNKYYSYYSETNDIEWLVYKVFWNSIKGATTREKFIQRRTELIKEGVL